MFKRDEIEIVKLDSNDSGQIEFLVKYLRPFYTPEILDWQYEFDDYSTSLFLLKDQDKYIGCLGKIPISLRYKHKNILSAKSESAYLLKEYRSKGLFEDLYTHTIENSEDNMIELIWGFTALGKVWEKKFNFEIYEGIIHETEIQISFNNAIRSIHKSELSIIKKISSLVKATIAFARKKKYSKTDYNFYTKELDINDNLAQDKIIELYTSWCEKKSEFICISPTKEFVNWRIKQNPFLEYKFIGIFDETNNELIGFGILNNSKSRSYLVDFIVIEEKQIGVCFEMLLKYVKANYRASHIVYWANSHNKYSNVIQSCLKSCGAYNYVNKYMNMVVKKTKYWDSNSIDISQFYINGLWTEGFKI